MMNKKHFAIIAAVVLGISSCKKDLAVENPNSPTPESVSTESGIIQFARGGVYINGFRDAKYSDGVFGPFWAGATGFHEMMGDVITCDAANAFMNQIGCPEYVKHDDGSTVLNPNSPNTQILQIRNNNVNAQAGNNTLYYEWAYMYNLVSSCNLMLEKAESVEFSGDAASKKAAVIALANWWKGFAYSRIGSTYYAGLLNDTYLSTNGNYVSKERMIEEAGISLDKAVAAAKSAPNAANFTDFIAQMIPEFFLVGKGQAVTPDMLERNVNTLKARNILVNKTTATMAAADWNSILSLVNNGITATDHIFIATSDERGDLYSANQFITGKTQSSLAGGNTYKISERWVQEFKPGDKRMENNLVETTPYLGQADRGNSHFTRYALINQGAGLDNVVVYANTDPGAYEFHLAGDYEENELMKAEALINTGKIDEGLAIIDAVRTYQGAGLAAVSGTGLSLAAAKEELRRERRIVIAFRGLSFYDARRWGITEPISAGGGRTGAIAVKNTGAVSTNATFEYNYLDYWDVPGNEITYNPPLDGSAPVVNPKQ
ncbi:RagB/SusD family nutrient uptake outer membrane protein [Flavihumibacter fluvii]|uniref:RagB/SusD family nutrient uptake outer membrane protein n=1 Tax=Flavihumibacter fluvii TaxID=2838157 RepID=UPI001BDE8C13|nr:RagB/SusD family nutrient uptake outer membrane protein [Flavihumibacter fluvii]ULQ51256.1 RagB/SusD family nutrient uptake outer membrane protein [Flavihumibacter fluvii]